MDEDAAAEKKPEESKPEEKKKLSETVKGGKWTWVVDFEDFGAPTSSIYSSYSHPSQACLTAAPRKQRALAISLHTLPSASVCWFSLIRRSFSIWCGAP